MGNFYIKPGNAKVTASIYDFNFGMIIRNPTCFESILSIHFTLT